MTETEQQPTTEQQSAKNKFTPNNLQNTIVAAIAALVMRFWNVSDGDWETIQPALVAFLDLVWPVVAVALGVAGQQFVKAKD